MPEVSRFLGIIIKMMYSDDDRHHKPHVHVYYGEYRASIALDGELLAGSLPARQLRIASGVDRVARERALLRLEPRCRRQALPQD